MTEAFEPGGIATLIGSLPLADHGAAADLILKHTPEIFFWAQLPVHRKEGMLAQFSGRLPGLRQDSGKVIVNTEKGNFDAYAFFDRFILYAGQIKNFIDSGKILAWGIDMQKLICQSLITPSCGMGSLGLDSAEKVIRLTPAVSRKARELRFSA